MTCPKHSTLLMCDRRYNVAQSGRKTLVVCSSLASSISHFLGQISFGPFLFFPPGSCKEQLPFPPLPQDQKKGCFQIKIYLSASRPDRSHGCLGHPLPHRRCVMVGAAGIKSLPNNNMELYVRPGFDWQDEWVGRGCCALLAWLSTARVREAIHWSAASSLGRFRKPN